MGAELNATNSEPSTTLDAQTIALEKLRRKRRNKCAETIRAASDLSDYFEWLNETIQDFDIFEQDRSLLRVVLNGQIERGRKSIVLLHRNDLCDVTGLNEGNLSRCIARCRRQKMLLWHEVKGRIEVGVLPPQAGFWVRDDGTPILPRYGDESWTAFMRKLDNIEANNQAELSLLIAHTPPPTCLPYKSSGVSSKAPTCASYNPPLPFGEEPCAPQPASLSPAQVCPDLISANSVAVIADNGSDQGQNSFNGQEAELAEAEVLRRLKAADAEGWKRWGHQFLGCIHEHPFDALRAVKGIEAGMRKPEPHRIKQPMSKFRSYARTAGWIR